MKICMLAPEFFPAWGGVGTYITELVRHLPKEMEIHVVTPIRDTFGKEKLSTFDSDSDLLKCLGSNVHIHFVCKASDTFFYNASFQYACFRYVPKLLKEEKFDLIHSHTAHMPDLLLMFRKLDLPTVTTVHTTIKSQREGTKLSGKSFYNLERSEKATYFMYPGLRFAEKMYFMRKRFYVTPSNWMKNWLEHNFSVNGYTAVIPNSVDITDYASKSGDGILDGIIPEELRDRRIILYVGRLLAMKGMDTLVEAIPKIFENMGTDQLLFVFAGPGDRVPYINKIKRMTSESGFLFTGQLPKHKIIKLMTAAELMVVPSFIENSPYSILESMACATPVIASNVGGIPEIISDRYNGLLIEPKSPDKLAKSILRLLDDKSLRNSIAHHARETIINKFSWSVNLKQYLHLYHDAVCNF